MEALVEVVDLRGPGAQHLEAAAGAAEIVEALPPLLGSELPQRAALHEPLLAAPAPRPRDPRRVLHGVDDDLDLRLGDASAGIPSGPVDEAGAFRAGDERLPSGD